ncbi:6-phosphogluconolactonase [Pseudoalteromonas fenneropenaei]|uniref:6-phosphogluconolactonase n=1 Tax=Pseudoalteromonas fenneropenaei TaxID=1737459 RepID=A0ABV7CN55_9GAMM
MAVLNEHFFVSKQAMTEALAELLQTELQAATAEGNEAVLMVSGGSSPKAAYEYLSGVDLAWDKITVAMVDERWVDANHDKSNEAFIKATLLQNKAQHARFVTMKNSAQTAQAGQVECEAAYQTLQKPFAVSILGMGPDGHTASLFPHADGLAHALTTADLTAAINAIESEVTGKITERMTLSLAGIAAAKQVVLLISGEDKRAVYEQAKQAGDVADMPLRAVLQHPDINLTVFWAP